MSWTQMRRFGSLAVLSGFLGLAACGGESTGPSDTTPTTGSVRITVSTTGVDLDADGYQVAIDGGTAQAIGVDATLTVSSVATGSRSVSLSGLAANCSVTGSNPVSTTVTGGGTANVTFAVACTSLAGFIEVVVNGAGANQPTFNAVTIDENEVLPEVVTNSFFTFGPYPVGDHTVEIDVAVNCTVAGSNPRTVTVASGSTELTVTTTFELTCTSTQGFIEVVVNGTGANQPTFNAVTIDGNAVSPDVVTNSFFTFGPYPVGDHTVEIAVAPNCTVAGSNPRTVTVPSGSTELTVTTTFELTCISTQGFIEVVVNGTGANQPTFNAVTIDGNAVSPDVVTNSFFTYGPYAVGDHTVQLTVAGNCTEAGLNPRTVTVPSGSSELTVTTTFDLTCS